MIRRKLNSGDLIEWLVLSIAFLIPFMPKLLTVLIILLVMASLLQGSLAERFKPLIRNRVVVLSVLLYFFYVIGLLWSENLKFGWLDLQIKLSLLVFPVLLTGIKLTGSINLNKVTASFCIGCLVALIICVIHALFMYTQNGAEGLFYQKLSIFLHPGYFAMYLNFSICYLMSEIILRNDNGYFNYRPLLFPVAIFLSAGLLLLSSKVGIFVLFLTLFATIVLLIVKKMSRKILFSLILILAGSLIITFSTPQIFKRWNEMSSTIAGTVEGAQGHTTGERLSAWSGAVSLIVDHPLTGVGTGDVKDALVDKYTEFKYEELVKKRLNAHNQFLQTTVALGIGGVFLLIMLLYTSFSLYLRAGNYLAVSFIVIIVINSMIESVLEVQAGVIFFAFFLGICNRTEKDNQVALP